MVGETVVAAGAPPPPDISPQGRQARALQLSRCVWPPRELDAREAIVLTALMNHLKRQRGLGTEQK